MKTKIEYAAWTKIIKDGKEVETYNNLSRREWLASLRLLLKCDIEEVKKEIRRNQSKERKDFKGYYRPDKFFSYPYHVPFIIAQYNIHPNNKWYYIQPYGKETTIICAARKIVSAFGHDPDSFHDDLLFDSPEHSFLDPTWIPNLKTDTETYRILDELTDINYHSLRSFIEENLTLKAA